MKRPMSFYPDHEDNSACPCGEPATENYFSRRWCRPCVAYDIASEKADAAMEGAQRKVTATRQHVQP